MIAVDTNLLVYAHREDSPHHHAASALLRDLATGPGSWAIPWPCVHEFLAVVTHPRIYSPPSSPAVALAAIAALNTLPNVTFLHETTTHLGELAALLDRGDVVGARIHDARIAAICLANGVSELWSADRDFTWFPALKTKNPLAH